MLRVTECKLKLDQPLSDLKNVIRKKLKCRDDFTFEIVRESKDARKEEIVFSYTVDVEIANEKQYLHLKDVSLSKNKKYQPICGAIPSTRPTIIGFGPAGIFCALTLAQAGMRPIVYERGRCVEKRSDDVERFWKEGILDENSNVQFGEGGAGAFSDGKLTSRSKDLRSHKVLEEFVNYGANPAILYESLPHIGSDALIPIIRRMREAIIEMGGEIHFESHVQDFKIEGCNITKLQVNDQWIDCDEVILAIGHSARDTFYALHRNDVMCKPKPFAVGVRIEHPQSLINLQQHGRYANHPRLHAAEYRLTHTTTQGRGVYTFCMCPGGKVVSSTSLKGHVVTNGMSYAARDCENANSAMLVQVKLEDVGEGLFDGLKFQEQLEKKAFELGGNNYNVPVQRVGDFLKHQPSESIGTVKPSITPGTTCCDLHDLFPDFINEALEEGLVAMDRKLKGFAMDDAMMSGVESRSTSPIQISRDPLTCVSKNISNLYPCGEGAGYAGGIVSAAIDGIRCAEQWLIAKGGKRNEEMD